MHPMPDLGCAIVYEACPDSNRYAPPKANLQVGRDIEFEYEAKQVFFSGGYAPSDKEIFAMIAKSKERLSPIIRSASPGIYESTLSKIQRGSSFVADYYEDLRTPEADIVPEHIRPGAFIALKLGVNPTEVFTTRLAILSIF